ncbi:ABCD4 [Lepeophtheirus salmonis]|uniref:ABCD4 n=1 Tax=Lepeophtheirus salmonis TaxID=72036 RepID=A0A7R8CKR1_LEPSM|nr:ABCD4 [Lepeophtheirus salmonis]CAF2850922.1 ABCD4 [Lepeophtheirus salmonis]
MIPGQFIRALVSEDESKFCSDSNIRTIICFMETFTHSVFTFSIFFQYGFFIHLSWTIRINALPPMLNALGRGSGPYGPLIIFGFFLFGTFINKTLLTPVVNSGVEVRSKEGDFRFKHAEIRSQSESLAFLGQMGSFAEASRVDHLLNLATNFFDYGASIISYLIVGIPVYNGFYKGLNVEELSGIISETAFVNIMLISKFSRLVDLAGKVSRLASVTHRVAEFVEKLSQEKNKGFEGF